MPAAAQTQVPVQNINAAESDKTDERRLYLKKILADNQRRYNESSANIDVKALEKIDRQQRQKKGWSGKQKLALVAIIVGIAAIVFVVAKYGKDCIRSEPAGCNPTTDDNCRCLEYGQNL